MKNKTTYIPYNNSPLENTISSIAGYLIERQLKNCVKILFHNIPRFLVLSANLRNMAPNSTDMFEHDIVDT